MFIIVLALVFSSAFGVFVVYSLRGKLSLAVISIWSAEGEAQNFAPDSDFRQTEHMRGRWPKKGDTQNARQTKHSDINTEGICN